MWKTGLEDSPDRPQRGLCVPKDQTYFSWRSFFHEGPLLSRKLFQTIVSVGDTTSIRSHSLREVRLNIRSADSIQPKYFPELAPRGLVFPTITLSIFFQATLRRREAQGGADTRKKAQGGAGARKEAQGRARKRREAQGGASCLLQTPFGASWLLLPPPGLWQERHSPTSRWSARRGTAKAMLAACLLSAILATLATLATHIGNFGNFGKSEKTVAGIVVCLSFSMYPELSATLATLATHTGNFGNFGNSYRQLWQLWQLRQLRATDGIGPRE